MSSNGFNLVTDPWIPIEGGPVSIEEALTNAHAIDGWPCSDPAFSEALMRLLVPMTYRITDMDDPGLSRYEFAERQGQLLAHGQFNADEVRFYLMRHRDRFWLINPPAGYTPFAQDVTLAAVDPKPPSKLVVSWASGNNPLLGPHAPSGELSADVAAQQLLIQRCYASGGLHTKHPAHAGKGKFVGSPLRGRISVHPVGVTLAATLMGHLVPLPHDTAFGQPMWEVAPPSPVERHRERSGLLEQIAVRQDKTMLLHSDAAGYIVGFTVSEGPGVNSDLFCRDPYWLAGSQGAPVKPKEGRAFWREAEALLRHADDGESDARSAILEWAIDDDGGLGNYRPSEFSWVAVSHRGDKSKELAWACSYAPDLLSIFDRQVALRCLSFLAAAGDAESQMAKQLAKVRHAADLMPSDPKSKGAVYAPARAVFWSRTEGDFWETARTAVTSEMRDKRLRQHALAGYDAATTHLLRDRRTHFAVVESRRWIECWPRQPNGPTSDREVSS